MGIGCRLRRAETSIRARWDARCALDDRVRAASAGWPAGWMAVVNCAEPIRGIGARGRGQKPSQCGAGLEDKDRIVVLRKNRRSCSESLRQGWAFQRRATRDDTQGAAFALGTASAERGPLPFCQQ